MKTNDKLQNRSSKQTLNKVLENQEMDEKMSFPLKAILVVRSTLFLILYMRTVKNDFE
jgi:hypothetical protein